MDSLITGLTKPATTYEDETLEDMLPRGEKLNTIADLEAFEKELGTAKVQKRLLNIVNILTQANRRVLCCNLTGHDINE